MANEDLGLIPEQPELTIGQRANRFMGLANQKLVPLGTAATAGALVTAPTGPGALAGAIGGVGSYALAHLLDLPAAGYNALKPESWPASPYPGAGFDNAVNGLAKKFIDYGQDIQPQDAPERFFKAGVDSAADAAGGVALGGAMKNIGSPVIKTLGNVFSPSSQSTAAQITTGAASGLSGEAAAEAYPDSKWARVVGGVVPAAAFGLPELARVPFRAGASQSQVQNMVDLFESVGSNPTLGQATGSNGLRRAEGLLSKMPFAGGRFAKVAKQQSDAIQSSLLEKADLLDPNATASSAGRAALSGVTENFIPQKRGVQMALYNKLDAFVPPDAPVNTSNFSTSLTKLTTPVRGANGLENARLLAAHPDIDELNALYQQAVKNGGGDLSFGALKDIRMRIGEKLSDFSLSSDKPTAQLKQLYGALTEDMKNAAKAAGPEAEAAFNRANNYTRSLNQRIDILENVVNKAGGPEKIFEAATAPGTNKFGATNLGALMKSLPDDAKKTFASAFIRNRLGRPPNGIQNAAEDAFSTASFMTNWSAMSPEAKNALFGHVGKDYVSNMDKLVKAASTIKESSKFYSNPSGTGAVTANLTSLLPAIGQFATGNFKGAMMFASPLIMGWAGARGLTSPNFVRWVAQSAKPPSGNIMPHLERLAEQARKSGDEDGAAAFDAVRAGMTNDHSDLGLIPDEDSTQPPQSRTRRILGE